MKTVKLLMLAAATNLGIGRAADVLTLEQAVEIAISQNRGLQNSTLDSGKAQDRVRANATRQLPAFSLSVTGSELLQPYQFTIERGVLGNPGTGPFPAEDVHLKSPQEPAGYITAKVSQPLTSLIRIRRNLDTLRTGVEI